MPEASLETTHRDAALDGLRGLSALGIIVWHYGPCITVAQPGSLLGYVNKALGLSWVGVDVFFVLSGFLIGATLLRERESPRYFSTFYARRMLRILPLYLTVLAAFFAGSALGLSDASSPFAYAWNDNGVPDWSYLPLIQNLFMPGADQFGSHLLTPTWSLAVEEQFYLIVPFLLHVLPRAALPATLGSLALLSAALRLWIGPGMAAYVLLPCRLDGLFIGVLLAWLLSSPAAAEWIRRRRRLLLGVGAVLFVPLALPILKSGLGSNVLHLPGGTLLHLWISVCAALLVAVLRVSSPGEIVPRLLSISPLRWAGLRAYGLYLIHPWPLHLLFPALGLQEAKIRDAGDLAVVGLAVVVTLVLSALSWRFLEAPCLRLAKSFRY